MPEQSATSLDVVVICEINVDIVVSGLAGQLHFGTERLVDAVRLTAGSSGVLTATALADLGLRVGVCGLIGDDPFGRFMLDHLDRHGIDRCGVLLDTSVHTGASVLLSNSHDRAILTDPGSMQQLRADQVPQELLDRTRHLHLSSYFLQLALQPGLPALLARAREQGLTTSADTGHDPEERWRMGDLLANLDVFLPNEVEALSISGCSTPDEALEWLAARVGVVAVKLGATGAIAGRGNQRLRLPGFAVRAVDTTGAGDSFDAGFLSGFLTGMPLEDALRRGNACGALTAAAIGGSGAISPAAVEALLRQ